jgi:hypothetical protein
VREIKRYVDDLYGSPWAIQWSGNRKGLLLQIVAALLFNWSEADAFVMLAFVLLGLATT